MWFNIISLAVSASAVIVSIYVIVNKQNSSFRAEISEKFDEINKKFEEVTSNTNGGFNKVTSQFNEMAIQVNTILQGDVRELRLRINKLESDQNEWIKTLRDRTHELTTQMNRIVLDVALMKKDNK